MSSTQLQQLMAQVEQLTLVNNKLQQELSSNSSHIARLESAMQMRRGIKPSEDGLSFFHATYIQYKSCLLVKLYSDFKLYD